jgi:hypothetical protein
LITGPQLLAADRLDLSRNSYDAKAARQMIPIVTASILLAAEDRVELFGRVEPETGIVLPKTDGSTYFRLAELIGREEAERDITAGRMNWRTYGHLAGMRAGDLKWKAQLRERFGVELTVLAS